MVGWLVARRGAVIVCGGLGGVMAAAAEGAAEAGGTSIGLLPGDDAEAAADHVTVALPTGLGEMRNGLIAKSCAGMIAIGGGYGTLSEIGFMLRLGRPVAALGTWDVRAPGEIERDAAVHWATKADEAVAWVFTAAGLTTS